MTFFQTQWLNLLPPFLLALHWDRTQDRQRHQWKSLQILLYKKKENEEKAVQMSEQTLIMQTALPYILCALEST